MRRRHFWLSILVAFSLLFLLGAGENSLPVGRFQLFQGTYYHHVFTADRKVASREQQVGVFLLDTATGETKLYISSSLASGWGRVTDIRIPE